ncbi:hypothetical protein AL525_001075 [Citrobacter amalonaticus]|nr:hypothetical protein AL525_001075 [Citrobacter amalonaticus]
MPDGTALIRPTDDCCRPGKATPPFGITGSTITSKEASNSPLTTGQAACCTGFQVLFYRAQLSRWNWLSVPWCWPF